jgi:transcriptional regulator with XRE-family HTH domain
MTETELNIYVGHRIAEFRKEKKVIQEVIAEVLGLSRTSVVNIEQGKQACDSHRLWQFASLFGKSLEEFFPPLVKYEIITSEVEVIVVKKKKKLSLERIEDE